MSRVYEVTALPLRDVLQEHATQWHSLYIDDVFATPFQRTEWIGAWWDCFEDTYLSAIAVSVVSRREPVAFLPLALRDDSGTVVARSAGERLSDYCSWVSRNDIEHDDALNRVLTYLRDLGIGKLHLSDVPSSSALHNAVLAQRATWHTEIVSGEPCPRMAFSGSWGNFWSSRGANLRHTINRARRRLPQEASAHTTYNYDPSEKDIKAFLALHLAWWRFRDQQSLIELPRVYDFLTTVCRRLTGSGAIVQSTLHLGSTTMASFLLLEDTKARYYYQSAVNPEFAAMQPGLLHLFDVAIHTHGSGFDYLDLLRGSERYKLQFANGQSQNVSVTFTLT